MNYPPRGPIIRVTKRFSVLNNFKSIIFKLKILTNEIKKKLKPEKKKPKTTPAPFPSPPDLLSLLLPNLKPKIY